MFTVEMERHPLPLECYYNNEKQKRIMDKTNATIILVSIAIGVLFAWLMGYTEWWQWLLSIVVAGIIVYCIVGICMVVLVVLSYFALRTLWRMYKKEIKFYFYVFGEKICRPFSSIEDVEEYVRENYKLE